MGSFCCYLHNWTACTKLFSFLSFFLPACVSVVSFLILRLAEEQAKPGSSNSSSATIKGDNQMLAENIEAIRNRPTFFFFSFKFSKLIGGFL